MPHPSVPVWDVGGRRTVADGVHQGNWMNRA
jgi:hypothetical protein